MSERPQYQWAASDYVVTGRSVLRPLPPLPKLPLRRRLADAWKVLTGVRRLERDDAIIDLQRRIKAHV